MLKPPSLSKAPGTVEQIAGGCKVLTAYVYGRETCADADAKVITMEEARPIASNIAKLPKLPILEVLA